jgi:hypothetical protein
MAKCVIKVTGHTAAIACGSSNLCAGLSAGIEGALHAMKEAPVEFARKKAATVEQPAEGAEDDDPLPRPQVPLDTQPEEILEGQPESVEEDDDPFVQLMLDAFNGFNELGRKAMLWTVRHLWAPGARFALNCYRHQGMLILRRKGDDCYTLFSQEGVTQGDPLSMILYGLALVPLANRLMECEPEVVQPWYADDCAMAGPASGVKRAVKLLQRWGPDRGYYPAPAKSIAVCHPAQ